jgi:nicotinamide mononucleotide transporter
MFNLIIEYFNHTWGYVELAGTLASAICVYLAVKQNIWTWFWGAIGVACFGPLFYHYQLYSDAALQILFFLPVQALGFYMWKYRGDVVEQLDSMMVTYLGNYFWFLTLPFIGVAAYINGYYMANYTDASFPYWDALTTWMSAVAQILMIRKFIESWYLWVTMDIIAIWIYFEKELYVVSGLYVVFLVLATLGGIAWTRAYRNQEIQNA